MKKKREKELEEEKKMYNYYEGAQGAKAIETLKKAEALEDYLNEGDELKRQWLNNSKIRDHRISDERRIKDRNRRDANFKSYNTVMTRAEELFEKRKMDSLKFVIDKEDNDKLVMRKQRKREKDEKDHHDDKMMEKLAKIKGNYDSV